MSHKLIAQNRRARFDYHITEEIEAGIVLSGSEVKSLRSGKISISESYAGEMLGFPDEIFLFNANIEEYLEANRQNHEPKRPRKLLLRSKQIKKLLGATRQKGFTIVPLNMYFNQKGKAKILISLAKGKNLVDKRETIKQRDWEKNKSKILRGAKNI